MAGRGAVTLTLGLVMASSAITVHELQAPATGSTVLSRVIELVKELREKVEDDGKIEQKMFDKYACWCEVTTKRVATNIHEAVAEIKSLGNRMLEMKGFVAAAVSQVTEHSKIIQENQKAQDEATAIRQKEASQYTVEKAEMEQTLAALEGAIKALAGHSLVQAPKPNDKLAALNIAATAREAARVLPATQQLSPGQLSVLAAFTRDPGSVYEQRNRQKAAQNPASATINGILKDMYDTFASNLERSTQAEASSMKNFELLTAVKKKEMATLVKARTQTELDKAEAEKRLADASMELDTTQTQLKADMAFFDDTKAACHANAAEWKERCRARAEELAGLNKAVEILDNDDARDLLGKAVKLGIETTLLQVATAQDHGPQEKAYSILKRAAMNARSLRLASLAMSMKERAVGHFPAVIEGIDKMIANLKEEGRQDYQHKDWCKEEVFKNEQEASKFEYKIEKIDTQIAKLTTHLQDLESARADALQEAQLTQIDVRHMEEVRTEEHRNFKVSKADDESAVKLISAAIEALSAYKPTAGTAPVSLLQKLRDEPDAPPPELSMSKKDANKNTSGGIVATLTMIKEDLEAEIAAGIKTEEEQQEEYMKSRGAAELLLKDLGHKEDELAKAIADVNSQLDAEDEQRADDESNMKEEQEYLLSIKPDCEWIFRAFDVRRQKRAQEIDGLLESKALLAGSAPEPAPVLLQRQKAAQRSRPPRSKLSGLAGP